MKKLLLILVGSLFLLTVLVVLWVAVPNRTIDREVVMERYITPVSKFYEWNGLKVHYTDEGEGVPVLMIHGYGGSHRNFTDLAALMKKDFRVVRVDLPGFALSDVPQDISSGEGIVEMYRRFMKDFIPDVVGDSIYVIGNSMGGWMAWEIASDMPEHLRGLVILNAAGYEMEKVVQTVVPFLKLKPVQALMGRGMPYIVSKRNIKACYADPAKMEESSVRAAYELNNREGNFPWMLRLAASGQIPDTSRIAQIQVPTLIVWGEKDNLIPYEHASRFERDIRGSEKLVYPDAGHLPMIEQPQRLYADFRRFFLKDTLQGQQL